MVIRKTLFGPGRPGALLRPGPPRNRTCEFPRVSARASPEGSVAGRSCRALRSRRSAGSSERAGDGVCPRPGCRPPARRWRCGLSPCGWPPAIVPIHVGFAAGGRRPGGVARTLGTGRAVTARAAGWPGLWGGVFPGAAGQPSIRPGRGRRVTMFPGPSGAGRFSSRRTGAGRRRCRGRRIPTGRAGTC